MLWLAIDIEKKHVSIEKGLFGIGCVLFDESGKILDHFQGIIINDEYDDGTRSFWAKHPDVLETLEKNARPFDDIMHEFELFLLKCRVHGETIGLVSDHPSFDIGHLEAHYAKVFPGRARLMTLLNEDWGPTEDIDGMYEILKKFVPVLKLEEAKGRHLSKLLSQVDDITLEHHTPLYDAICHAAQKLMILEIV